MKLGNKFYFFLISFIFLYNLSLAENTITSTPLINLNEIKPSFEELNDTNEKITINKNLKEKKKIK